MSTATFLFTTAGNYTASDSTKLEVSGKVSGVARVRQVPLVSDANTALLLHLDNNVTDSSSYAHTVTNTNGTFTAVGASDFLQGHYGVLNGSSAWYTVPNHASLIFGADSTFTFECWFTSTDVTNAKVLFDTRDGSNVSNYMCYVQNGKIYFGFNSGDWQFVATNSAVLSINTWYHFAITCTFGHAGVAAVVAIFLTPSGHPGDQTQYSVALGNMSWVTNNGQGVPVASTQVLAIGKEQHTGNYPWPGNIDEVRLSRVIRATTEFSNRYDTTSPSVKPTAEGGEVAAYSTLSAFAETLTAANAGSVTYKLSLDGTNYWKWTGAAWATTDITATGAVSAATINSNISTFVAAAGTGTLYFLAFLVSDGGQKVELDTVTVTYADVPVSSSNMFLFFA
jgi:hypothetical protein